MDFKTAREQGKLQALEEARKPFESVVLIFRNGCRAEYAEQPDGTYQVSIDGKMYPRHLRAINQIFEIFKECSKEDRPTKPLLKPAQSTAEIVGKGGKTHD